MESFWRFIAARILFRYGAVRFLGRKISDHVHEEGASSCNVGIGPGNRKNRIKPLPSTAPVRMTDVKGDDAVAESESGRGTAIGFTGKNTCEKLLLS